ncbi:MAG: serine protease [Gammaproteobacteria bacterium]|nr:MAG: serine protease [Gammaproteobacteria bacterium]TLZ27018.1 MAG: serine protease [Gammaproteobacteria bacterium]TLZ48345.1 MAG: serine protease [Gammaproteobacteria bacterium]
MAAAGAGLGRELRAGRRARRFRTHRVSLVAMALHHPHHERARHARRPARCLRALAAGRGAGGNAALGRRARGRGTGNEWNIRHRAGHYHGARQRALRRGEPADARARGAIARRRAGALGRAADRDRWGRGRAGTTHAGTVMRAFTRAGIVCLALLGGTARAAPPAAAPASPPPRIVVAFANEPHTTPAPAGTTGSHYAGDGYRVAQSAQQQARRVAAAYALRPVASWPIKALSMHCVVYEITDGRPVSEVLAALSKDSRVVLAQPLQEFHTLSDPPAARPPYNDPLYDLQTNLLTLGIARAHERAQGAGVRVALIDTGVDARHPDLTGRIVRTHSFLTTRTPAASFLRHGTAMAGLIAAVANNHVGIVGIAPQAQLEVFEACWQLRPDDDAAACNTFTLAQALAAALASGAPLINLSLAGPADPLLSALVQSGLKHGVTFVGAAGAADEGFPTAIPGVIGASGSEQALPAGAFTVPAEHVLTLRPGAQYDFESGTSVAAAELTGVIALLMSGSSARLATDTIVSLLREGAAGAASAAADPVDVTAALARLDARQHRGAVAVRAGH